MALEAAAAATALRSSGGAGSVAGGSVAEGSVAGDGDSGAGAGGAAEGAEVPSIFFCFAASASIFGPGALNFLSESGTVATGSDAGAEGLVEGTGMSGAGGSVTRGGDEGIVGAGGGGGGGGARCPGR